MTLQYKLLGKPGNLEEFVEVARQKGGGNVKIVGLEWYHKPDMLDGKYEIHLMSGTTRFTVKGYLESTTIDGGRSLAFSNACAVAEDLERRGLEIKVFDMTLEETKEKKERLYQKWYEGLMSFGNYSPF